MSWSAPSTHIPSPEELCPLWPQTTLPPPSSPTYWTKASDKTCGQDKPSSSDVLLPLSRKEATNIPDTIADILEPGTFERFSVTGVPSINMEKAWTAASPSLDLMWVSDEEETSSLKTKVTWHMLHIHSPSTVDRLKKTCRYTTAGKCSISCSIYGQLNIIHHPASSWDSYGFQRTRKVMWCGDVVVVAMVTHELT